MKGAWLVGLLVFVLGFSVANALIVTAADDGDGKCVCQSGVWTPVTSSTDGQLAITEQMWGEPGHIMVDVGQVGGDPKIKIIKDVTNDSGEVWSGYHFNIFMQQAFTIDNTPSTLSLPADWTYSITPVNVDANSFFDSHGVEYAYAGAVDFTGGTPIALDADTLFGCKISFNGPVSFEVEQSYVTPEPISLALLALGGFCLRRRRLVFSIQGGGPDQPAAPGLSGAAGAPSSRRLFLVSCSTLYFLPPYSLGA